MNGKKTWLIVGGLVVVAAAAIAIAISNKKDVPDYSQPKQSPNGSQQNSTDNPAMVPAEGAYVKYDEKVFEETLGRRWLFFHAGWCPQCRALQKDIEKNGVPSGVTIFETNYDTEGDLKQKYGVTLQTTVVEVDAAGNEVQKFVAYDDPTIEAVMNALGS